MRAREFIIESNNIASAEQVWDYVDGVHPKDQQGGGFLKSLVMRNPQYELKRVPLSSLHVPNDEDEGNDPYGRAMFVDADHAREYSQHHIDKKPLVIDSQGHILDGAHRAWAAVELLNKTDIMAWVPVKQSVSEGKLSVDVPNEDWLQEKIDYAKSKGRNSYGVPYFGSTTAYVQGTPPRARVMRLASLPGMKNEQMNVRKNDLKWLMDYMEKTGKLPPMGNSPDHEYLPYIMVAYNGEAWVNEGNHRIMAAYRLNWQDMPIEIRYFDGGERIKTGPMAPEKIGLG